MCDSSLVIMHTQSWVLIISASTFSRCKYCGLYLKNINVDKYHGGTICVSSISILNGCSICNILSVYNRLNNNKKVFIIFHISKFYKNPKLWIFVILHIHKSSMGVVYECPTQNVGPIGSAVLKFIGYKQTDKQIDQQFF